MSISYQGIGEWCATFKCGADVSEDTVVKAGAENTAEKCGAEDAFAAWCARSRVTARLAACSSAALQR